MRRDGYALTVRSSIKLPTGDETRLLGSGAADLALGLYASGTRSMFNRPLGLSGFAGALALGDGEALPGQQRDLVPFGGIAASWWIGERLALTTQLQVQGAYLDSEVGEPGGSTTQLDVGLTFRLHSWRSYLKFAVVEDIQANATTDFGLHFALDTRCGAR